MILINNNNMSFIDNNMSFIDNKYKSFNIIVGAHQTNMAIGSKNKIPWKCRTDMKFFKETTTKTKDPTKINAIIMGRKTFESLPSPLSNRINVVLTSKLKENNENIFFFNNFDEALDNLEKNQNIETIFVIGGEMVYKQAITHSKCNKIYLNLVNVTCDLSESDAFFPEIDLNIYELNKSDVLDNDVTSLIYIKKIKQY